MHTRTIIINFILVVTLTCGSPLAQSSRCVQGQNCHLPDCFCPTFKHPFFQDVKDIPQMVYFGFDDALQAQVGRFYSQLFTKERRNPNGCPITMSLYVQDQWTSYGMVNSYYQRGMEIGSHSVTHTNIDTGQKLEFEAGRQKDNLTRVGHVPSDQVVGWRSPNLKSAGDAQPDVLKRLGYTYDISLTYTRHNARDAIPWPYTLDYGYPYPCSVQPCPASSARHSGFWEIPVPSLYNPESGYPCAYVDSCRPSDEKAALEYLWSNFEKVYTGNRAPFGLNMHAAWFFTPAYLRATHTFIQRLLQQPDVYILSARQVLDWMRSPVKVSEVSKLAEWGCAGATPVHTSHPNTEGSATYVNSQHSSSSGERPNSVNHGATVTPRPAHYQYYFGNTVSPRVHPALGTTRPPTITFRPPFATYQPVHRTYQPYQWTHQPPHITYRPPSITYQPFQRTHQPPSVTYRPPSVTYRPPSVTYQPFRRTYRPPTITYRPPQRTYRPPSITYRPPQRTYRPSSVTYRPPNTIFHLPMSFIPHQSLPSQNQMSNPVLPGSGGTQNHHHRNPSQPSPVLINLSYHPISPAHNNNNNNNNNANSNLNNNIHTTNNSFSNDHTNIHATSNNLNNIYANSLNNDHTNSLKNNGLSVSSGNNLINIHGREEEGIAGSPSPPGGHVQGYRDLTCRPGITCSPPSCACRSLVPPAGLRVQDTPQMVYLTFTGRVNGLNYQRVVNLLTSSTRRNPNNCPVTATFFLPRTGNYVPYVQNLRGRGDEIAMYGQDPYLFDPRSSLQQQVMKEVEGFRQQESSTGQTTAAGSARVGYRSPDGDTLGKELLEGLHAGKVTYDSSLVTSHQALSSYDVIPWPYTLDYGWKDCKHGASNCSFGQYPGVWEVPLVPLVDNKQNSDCTYADACRKNPSTSQDVYNFFMDNLHHALTTNRAPLGINLRNEWFSDPRFYSNFRGLQMFLDTILTSRHDVFVVSVEKMLDWMRDPTELNQIKSFEAWKC